MATAAVMILFGFALISKAGARHPARMHHHHCVTTMLVAYHNPIQQAANQQCWPISPWVEVHPPAHLQPQPAQHSMQAPPASFLSCLLLPAGHVPLRVGNNACKQHTGQRPTDRCGRSPPHIHTAADRLLAAIGSRRRSRLCHPGTAACAQH